MATRRRLDNSVVVPKLSFAALTTTLKGIIVHIVMSRVLYRLATSRFALVGQYLHARIKRRGTRRQPGFPRGPSKRAAGPITHPVLHAGIGASEVAAPGWPSVDP